MKKKTVMFALAAISLLGSALAAPSAQAQPPGIFGIIGSTSDVDGLDVPVRVGQNVKPLFGKAHACGKHNIICGPIDAALVAVQSGEKDPNRPPENPNWTVNLYNVNNPAETEDVLAGGFTGNVLAPLGPTPEGRPVGILTTFCVGKELCPDWIAYAPFIPEGKVAPQDQHGRAIGFGVVGDANYRSWLALRP